VTISSYQHRLSSKGVIFLKFYENAVDVINDILWGKKRQELEIYPDKCVAVYR
jgi:hypothetical protein